VEYNCEYFAQDGGGNKWMECWMDGGMMDPSLFTMKAQAKTWVYVSRSNVPKKSRAKKLKKTNIRIEFIITNQNQKKRKEPKENN